MNYREANINNVGGIVKVKVDTWKTTYKGIISNEYLQNLSYDENELKWKKRFMDQNNKSIIYVAETENQKIVGFALANLEKFNPIVYLPQAEKFIGELGAIYVLKEFQDKRIGTKLVQLVVEYLLKHGIISMIVWVLRDNLYRSFYEKLGGIYIGEQFIEIGRTKYVEVAYGWYNIGTIL